MKTQATGPAFVGHACTRAALLAAALLVAAGSAVLQAAQRPIEDFLVNQGTATPERWTISWTDPLNHSPASWAFIDYAGVENAKLLEAGLPSLGTVAWGTVNERPLPDGRAEVEVVLHARNALAWAYSPDGTLLFGRPVEQVMAGAEPALGSCTLKLHFINTAPGAPLPDYMQLAFWPDPGMQILSESFVGQADGLMADGTRGRLEITQVGLDAVQPPKPPMYDGWPVEHILLRHVGR